MREEDAMLRIHAVQMIMIAATVMCISLLPSMSDRLLSLSGINYQQSSLRSSF
jgi:hypothetical protein